MPTLYVENVPEELYEALRTRARSNRTSIAAEVISVLEEMVPTVEERKRREEFFRRVLRLRSRRPPSAGAFPSTEQMQHEDRSR
jgi:plasmid stability protein